jgi:hypothetical protein
MPDEKPIMTPETESALSNLYNSVIKKVDSLTKLTITTIVSQNGADEKKIETVFNVLEGDIKTSIDTAFIVGEFKEIRDFHSEREKQAIEIFKNNVKLVQDLANWVKDLYQKK